MRAHRTLVLPAVAALVLAAAPSPCPAEVLVPGQPAADAGRRQSERRPAIVLSRRGYNECACLCVVCPVTSQVKGYPLEVALPKGLAVGGALLSDHVKSADGRTRDAPYADKAPDKILAAVRAKRKPLLGT
jgi:mRNA interferase MazF